ncbi:MAG: hypothetical protein ACLRX3_04315 [Subdoligranulum sp.]
MEKRKTRRNVLWESADIDDLISKKAPPDFSSGDAFLAIKIEKKTKAIPHNSRLTA